MADVIRPFEGQKNEQVLREATERAAVEAREKEASRTQVETEEALPQEVATTAKPVSPSVSQASTHREKSELFRRVEQILEEEIGEAYFTMTPRDQERFKKKGEETANAIEDLLQRARATAAHIITLLKAWLKLIPGVSTFFIEQEAKIKTDKLMRLQQKKEN